MLNFRKLMSALVVAAAFSVCGVETVDGIEMLPSHFDGKTPVVVETEAFKLVVNPDATARSLVIKATGEECLAPETGLPVFASVQKRPFNNETRLLPSAFLFRVGILPMAVGRGRRRITATPAAT